MSDITAELILDAKAELAEGPVWHAPTRALFWVNILAGQVHVLDPASGIDRSIAVGRAVGVAVPRKSGGLVLGLKDGFAFLDLKTERITPIHNPEPDKPNNRFNDGKCDPAGRFWAGTMAFAANEPSGSLYRLDKNLSVHHMISSVSISNGLAWSHDRRTMYYIDTATFVVAAFDYDNATGDITNRREVIRFDTNDHGYPDGMTIDVEGMLWVAHFGTGQVTRSDPSTGKVIGRIVVPNVSNVTCCTFGGSNLDELYITTATEGMKPEDRAKQPHAGGLYRATPGVRGTETIEFAG